MLKVVKDVVPGADPTYFVSGVLDDSVNLWEVFGNVGFKFRVNLRGLTKINSVGLKNWISYATRCVESGISITYIQCAPCFTYHLRMINHSGARGAIESVMAPFHCTKCKQPFAVPIRTPDFSVIKPQLASVVCPQCTSPAEFDEIPQEYFQFLA